MTDDLKYRKYWTPKVRKAYEEILNYFYNEYLKAQEIKIPESPTGKWDFDRSNKNDNSNK